MRKHFMALALCVLLVSTVAAAGVVTAAHADKSDVRQYDVQLRTGGIIGTLTVNLKDGHYVFNGNCAKVNNAEKGICKAQAGESFVITASNPAATPPSITFGSFIPNKGGNAHVEGTLTTALNHPDVKVVDWLAQWGSGATFVV